MRRSNFSIWTQIKLTSSVSSSVHLLLKRSKSFLFHPSSFKCFFVTWKVCIEANKLPFISGEQLPKSQLHSSQGLWVLWRLIPSNQKPVGLTKQLFGLFELYVFLALPYALWMQLSCQLCSMSHISVSLAAPCSLTKNNECSNKFKSHFCCGLCALTCKRHALHSMLNLSFFFHFVKCSIAYRAKELYYLGCTKYKLFLWNTNFERIYLCLHKNYGSRLSCSLLTKYIFFLYETNLDI